MAARKNNRGRRRNRGRFGFLYVLLSFILIVAAILVGSMVFFRVDQIKVSGHSRYTREEIIAASGIRTGDNLFHLNGARVAPLIYDSLPYIRSASIRPVLPSGVTIVVTESAAAAAIEGPDAWYLMDARGKLVEAGPETLRGKAAPVVGLTPLAPTVGTPLSVPEKERIKFSALTGLLTALETHNMLEELTNIDLSSSSVLTFGFTSRFTVEMPLNSDFDYKVRSLEYVLGQLEVNETGLIDMTMEGETHFIPY